MKNLCVNETTLVSGGTNLVISQQIPTDGLSNVCVAALPSLIECLESDTSEEAFILRALSFCTFNEFDIIEERLATIAPFKIELICR